MECTIKTNKVIVGATAKQTEETVNYTSGTTSNPRMAHKDMKLKREQGTCHWCGYKNSPHAWNNYPAKG